MFQALRSPSAHAPRSPSRPWDQAAVHLACPRAVIAVRRGRRRSERSLLSILAATCAAPLCWVRHRCWTDLWNFLTLRLRNFIPIKANRKQCLLDPLRKTGDFILSSFILSLTICLQALSGCRPEAPRLGVLEMK